MTTTLDYALKYAEQGWACFPLHGKVPATPRGFKDASTDPEVIRGWFEDREHNIGVAIPEGHVVLDVDPRAGGTDTLEKLRSQLPASTLVAKTGRGDGGLHLWFKGDVPKVKLPGVDVKRAGKGYVVAPPSKHPDTGGEYQWVNWGAPVAAIEGTLQVTGETDLGDDLTSLLGADSGAREAAEGSEPIHFGEQHDTLLAIAAHALAKYPPAVARLVYDAGVARCEPPHPKAQAESIWSWVYEQQDTGDGLVEDKTVAALGIETDGSIPRFVPIDWHELLTGDIPEPDWLCEPIIEAARQVALYSDAKAGKSLIMLDASCGIATGRAALGNPARKPRIVVYIDLENTTDDIRERVTKLGYGWEELTGRLYYYSFPSLRYLDTPEGGREVYEIASAHTADLVVIDTLSRVTEGDENENDTYHNFYKHTGVPLKRAGIAMVRLDHAGKDARKGMRGASAKTSDVDAVWALTADGNLLTLERTHSRNSHGAGKIMLQRLDDPLRHVSADVPFDVFEESEPAPEGDVAEIISVLDDLGVPDDAGLHKAAKAYRDAGHKGNTDRLREAQKQRQKRAEGVCHDLENEGGVPGASGTGRQSTYGCARSDKHTGGTGWHSGHTSADGDCGGVCPTGCVPIGDTQGHALRTPTYKPYEVPFDLEAVLSETAAWRGGGDDRR